MGLVYTQFYQVFDNQQMLVDDSKNEERSIPAGSGRCLITHILSYHFPDLVDISRSSCPKNVLKRFLVNVKVTSQLTSRVLNLLKFVIVTIEIE